MAKLNRIKAVLAEQEKTSKWLAEQVGKSACTVSKWCSNSIQPDLNTFDKIAKLLDVDVKDLLNSTEKQKQNGNCYRLFKNEGTYPLFFHAYSLDNIGGSFMLYLKSRLSTESRGISTLLGLNAKANIQFDEIARILEAKISDNTVFDISV